MGADFIYAVLPKCELTEERKGVLLNLVDAMKMEDFEDDLEDGGNGEGLEKKKDILEAAVDSYAFHSSGNGREVGELLLKGGMYILTGGMSWGDAPTDAWDDFYSLGFIPNIWGLLESWMEEDVSQGKL